MENLPPVGELFLFWAAHVIRTDVLCQWYIIHSCHTIQAVCFRAACLFIQYAFNLTPHSHAKRECIAKFLPIAVVFYFATVPVKETRISSF